MKPTNIQVEGITRKQLDDIINKRKENGDVVKTRRGLVQQLIERAYKKEVLK